jgi:hypothetical protein
MTLVGGIAALVLNIIGYRTSGKYGYCWVFKVGDRWGGASLGPVIITGKTFNSHTMKHEHGHAIQNCWFGPFMPFIVCIPSAIRYWYRELRYLRNGKTPPTAYDDAWFEGQATRVGTEFIKKNYGG